MEESQKRPIKCCLCYRESTHPLCEKHYQQFLVDNYTKTEAAKNDWINDQYVEMLDKLMAIMDRLEKLEQTVNKKLRKKKTD